MYILSCMLVNSHGKRLKYIFHTSARGHSSIPALFMISSSTALLALSASRPSASCRCYILRRDFFCVFAGFPRTSCTTKYLTGTRWHLMASGPKNAPRRYVATVISHQDSNVHVHPSTELPYLCTTTGMTKSMFYGYVMECGWLYGWGVENGCAPTGPFFPHPFGCDIRMATIRRARKLVLKKAGVRLDAEFRGLRIDGAYRMCIILTTNEQNPLDPLLNKERYDKLKEVLETEDDPAWRPWVD